MDFKQEVTFALSLRMGTGHAENGEEAKVESGEKEQHIVRIPVNGVVHRGKDKKKFYRRKLVEVACAKIKSKTSYIIYAGQCKIKTWSPLFKKY